MSKSIDTFDGMAPPLESRIVSLEVRASSLEDDGMRIAALEVEIRDQFKAYCVLEGRFAAVEANNVSLNKQMRRTDDIVQRRHEASSVLRGRIEDLKEQVVEPHERLNALEHKINALRNDQRTVNEALLAFIEDKFIWDNPKQKLLEALREVIK